jgi:hypothetical protein
VFGSSIAYPESRDLEERAERSRIAFAHVVASFSSVARF